MTLWQSFGRDQGSHWRPAKTHDVSFMEDQPGCCPLDHQDSVGQGLPIVESQSYVDCDRVGALLAGAGQQVQKCF